MGFLDRLNNIFRKKDNEPIDFSNTNEILQDIKAPEEYEPIELPEGELVSFSDEIIDTNSREATEKLKHNLKVLIERAKQTKKVDKFMLIREDDFFPEGWEWRVLSKNTNFEKVSTNLSYEIRKAYALEQNGVEPYKEIMGVKVPTMKTFEETMEALSKVDKNLGSVLLPSRFRSTKHFTINTPLGVTGDYNLVSTNRDYIIIDDINNFLNSGYGYSIAYRDAYLDVSHESLPISENAVVLIDNKNYDRIMSDEKIASELAQRKVIRFKGDETVAIDMVLTQMGALPSRVGSKYANYDNEIYDILDNSIRELAEENDLLFSKSHGGELKAEGGGHFSNYYDDKNKGFEKASEEFLLFLKQKFPEQEELFSNYSILKDKSCQEIIEKLGTTNLLDAIEEYNQLASQRIKKSLEEHKEDRRKITPEIHQKFVNTVKLINSFYEGNTNIVSNEIEDTIQRFIQSDTVAEQLEAADNVWNLLPHKDTDRTEISTKAAKGSKAITMANVLEEALNGTTTDKVKEAENMEKAELRTERANEGATKND